MEACRNYVLRVRIDDHEGRFDAQREQGHACLEHNGRKAREDLSVPRYKIRRQSCPGNLLQLLVEIQAAGLAILLLQADNRD